jgi:amidase/6-aminohexanoate-cyclic-dimer hydrolase
MDAYAATDALGLAERVRLKQVSPAELVETAIARAEAANPKINAIAERLYNAARRRAQQPFEGPFAGVPWVVKDLGHPVAGAHLTGGSRAFRDVVAAEDAESVRRFRAAGLNIFATSTSPEFGLTVTTESKLFGETHNPWDLSRSAGGSSGGAAALVAAGVLPAAHATDGGGSIRIPAACCGLFGMKPSRGRSPVAYGRTEGWNGLGVSHAVTRSVRDSAALMDAIQGPELGSRSVAPPPPPGGFLGAVSRTPAALLGRAPRVALMVEPFTDVPVHPECRKAAEETAKLCEQLGWSVEEARPQVDGRAIGKAMMVVVSTHTALTIAAREAELGRPLRDDELEVATWDLVRAGRDLKAVDLAAADVTFMTAAIAVARFQERYDLILSPTLAAPPAPLGTVHLDQSGEDFGRAVGAYSPYTALYNQTGAPAASLPLHWTPEGLPIGVHLAARLGEEALLFSVAAELERAQPWSGRRSPVAAALG